MKNGFTLIELMIAVAIVGILAAIAIPSYTAYIRRGNRTDATRTMTFDAQALERCYSQNFDYVTNCPVVGGILASPQGYYNVTITIVNAAPATNTPASYSIKAVPIAPPQLNDSACMRFQLDSAGTQQAWDSGSVLNTQPCWGST